MNTCFCLCGAVQALKLFFGTMMAAPATINFRVTQMVVQKFRGLLRIRTRFLSMYVYIYIIHGAM